MTAHFHSYQISSGHGLPHDPFKAIIAPRPIGWIASQNKQGDVNLAPYSFFNAFSNTPPLIGFSSIGLKDSVNNIRETGEFCWSLATYELANEMNKTSASVDNTVDEFQLAGLEKRQSDLVSTPHVAASPASMECKLTQSIPLTDVNGKETDAWLVVGQVVAVHLNKAFITEDGVFDTVKANSIMRAGGPADYFRVIEAANFKMSRPG